MEPFLRKGGFCKTNERLKTLLSLDLLVLNGAKALNGGDFRRWTATAGDGERC